LDVKRWVAVPVVEAIVVFRSLDINDGAVNGADDAGKALFGLEASSTVRHYSVVDDTRIQSAA